MWKWYCCYIFLSIFYLLLIHGGIFTGEKVGVRNYLKNNIREGGDEGGDEVGHKFLSVEAG